MAKKNIEALEKELKEARAKIKAQAAYNKHMTERYQLLWECTELLPKAVARQLAIINLNVGEWEQDDVFYKIKLPAVELKIPK